MDNKLSLALALVTFVACKRSPRLRVPRAFSVRARNHCAKALFF
jgi:hypothetical protein